mgnify:CR=1 FL=1
MIQVQRFNKALKSAVIIGDLAILNILFVSLYILWTTYLEQKVFNGTLPQILVLFSLCYFACTISRGIILHRRGVRADQVVQHSLRNMFYFILLSMATFTLADFGEYSHSFFIIFYLLFPSASFATGWPSAPALKYTEDAEATHARQSIWEARRTWQSFITR